MSDRPQGLPGLTAVLLAGGLGTRLRSVLPDCPKVLAPVNGRPFVLYLLDQLAAVGIREAILCTGYKADLVRETVGTHRRGMRIRYSVESKPLGTAGAVRLALPMIKTDHVLVMNGDSYVDTDLQDFYLRFRSWKVRTAMLLIEKHDTQRYGRVEISRDQLVTEFHEKSASAGKGWVNAGVYLFETVLLKRIPPGNFVSMEQDFFPGRIAEGIRGCPVRSLFIDIGVPESYADAGRFFDGITG
jgi:D-glycero-alpha-D-manno-heptose 1-phosphate guanylyltransferase